MENNEFTISKICFLTIVSGLFLGILVTYWSVNEIILVIESLR